MGGSMCPVSEASADQISKERLAFTLYHILHEFDPGKRGYLTHTRFNKIAYLIHKDIRDNLKINTGLPWHWYLFGSVVALEYCPSDVYIKHEIEDGNWRLFYGREPKTEHIPPDQQKQILERVRYWREKYLKTDDAIDIAYSDVEFPFLREIKRFSDSVEHTSTESKKAIVSQLDKMMEVYPEEHLVELTSIYLRLDNMLRIIANTDSAKVRNYSDMIEDFRKLTLLRLGVLVSENMPEAWILEQTDEFARDKERFQSEFDEIERKIFRDIKEEKDKTGYAKKLMEISWQMYSEG
jgi:hypothetical protein